MRRATLLGSILVCGVGLTAAGPTAVGRAAAQQVEPDAVADTSRRDTARNGEGGWLSAIAGDSPRRNRVIPGLWAMHPFEPHFPELDGTSGFGGLWGHWLGATFVNSYGERTFIVGVERNWVDFRRGWLGMGAGYRAGLITGYDERLLELARHTPVLPFGGVLLWTQVGPLGLDAYYVYRAMTLEASVVF